MNILMLCYEFPPVGGGGSRVVAGLAPGLVQQGHEVDLVTMGFRGLPREEVVNGVRVYRVPCWRRHAHVCTVLEAFSYVCAALPVVLRLARRRRFDINHTHFILPDGLLAFAVYCCTGLPYVMTAHGSDVPGYNPDRLQFGHWLLAPLWHAIVHRAQRIICPSRMLEQLVLRQQRDAQTSLIPNGIRLTAFASTAASRRGVLIVTRMLERKGVQYALQAIQELDGKLGQHEVRIVGDGPYLPVLKQQAQQLGSRAEFLGWLDNASPQLRQLYERSSIFIFPSATENFPVVLLEAMAAGLAIITTASTGCAEVVGDTALLVPASDSAAIRMALERLLGDEPLRRRLGEAARRRLEERFSWASVTARHLALYAQHVR